VPDANAVAELIFTDPQAFMIDPTETLVNSTTGNYNATETIWAAYGMGRFHFGPLTLLAGSRIEGTHVTTSGSQINFNPDGTLRDITPVQGTSDYLNLLPGLHLRYDSAPGLLVRTSLTRSLARPNYSDLVPRQQIGFTDRRSRVGNADLKPYLATNFDLAVDRYNEKTGLLSAAFFYKKIDHFIIDSQYPVTLGDLGNFTQYTRANGNSAQVFGLETNWQSPLRDLPADLGRGSITLGATLMRSQTHVPDRPGETFPLFEQANEQANATLHWEHGKASGDFSLRYRSKALEDFVAPGFDNYRTAYFDAELTTAYKLNRSAKLTFGLGNLLNLPAKNYSGIASRMNEYRRSGIDFTLGLQWKI
jgi:TonB-dependent receptor